MRALSDALRVLACMPTACTCPSPRGSELVRACGYVYVLMRAQIRVSMYICLLAYSLRSVGMSVFEGERPRANDTMQPH
eukprot:10649520-Alexandrium_andersonii.AAC.1